ncbi:MAG: DUF1015 domain-containing protein [Bacillota bacterium]|nr:DUF1015 domain-containing protein [Bacillota bacterium]
MAQSAERTGSCFKMPEIFLPGTGVDLAKWAVIACDQYTSQPEYWDAVEKTVGDAPSTLRLVLPEIYLGGKDEKERIRSICETMRKYHKDGLLRSIGEGYMLVERDTLAGKRSGLLLALDLECYDYSKNSGSLIRPTEDTIEERIPPRLKVRSEALFELPHIMVLVDDPEDMLLGPLMEKKESCEKVYGLELMLGGGRVEGRFIRSGSTGARSVEKALGTLCARARERAVRPILFAVGDGNHSLATAKAHYEKLKEHGPGAILSEPRYALTEVVNLHEPAIVFHPIHRAVFGAGKDLPGHISEALGSFEKRSGQGRITLIAGGRTYVIDAHAGSIETIRRAEEALASYANEHKGCRIDYIHDEEVLKLMAEEEKCAAVFMPRINKRELFSYVEAHGVLPRKAFSIGHSLDKRYYLEARMVGA